MTAHVATIPRCACVWHTRALMCGPQVYARDSAICEPYERSVLEGCHDQGLCWAAEQDAGQGVPSCRGPDAQGLIEAAGVDAPRGPAGAHSQIRYTQAVLRSAQRMMARCERAHRSACPERDAAWKGVQKSRGERGDKGPEVYQGCKHASSAFAFKAIMSHRVEAARTRSTLAAWRLPPRCPGAR